MREYWWIGTSFNYTTPHVAVETFANSREKREDLSVFRNYVYDQL
jgi:hypothetical protein